MATHKARRKGYRGRGTSATGYAMYPPVGTPTGNVPFGHSKRNAAGNWPVRLCNTRTGKPTGPVLATLGTADQVFSVQGHALVAAALFAPAS